ncbi:PucR family transcriptional regulator [soil metagenome]
MPLWIEQLLDDPGLGLQLVAGRGGLRQRGPIRWVHASEIPDPTPWLEGGEVLLTTGMGVLDSSELQRKLIAGLDARGCAAVGFGVGICADEVPEAMREEAEARDLPLFSVPYAVPFIAVTKRISRHIFDEHYATLRSAVDLHRQVLAAVLSGAGLPAVLDTVGRALPEHRMLVHDYYGQPLAGAGRGGADTDPATVWARMGPLLRDDDRVEAEVDGQPAVGAAIRLGDQVEAYLVMLGDRQPHEHERLLLEQALTGVSMELSRGRSAREAHRTRVEELIAEVVEGRLGGQVLADRLARLGVDVTAGYAVLCVTPGTSAGADRRRRTLTAVVEDALASVGPPVLGRVEDVLYALVPSDSTAAERVATAAQARGWPDVAVGRSRVRTDADGLPASLREAHVAATVAAGSAAGRAAGGSGAVRDIGALGLPGLLAGIDDSLGADAFVDHVLGPVLVHDATEGIGLAATLRAYQRHGCRPGPAAAELGIHRHTLTYRLERIRDLTGRDPRDGAHLLAYGLALELHERRGSGP